MEELSLQPVLSKHQTIQVHILYLANVFGILKFAFFIIYFQKQFINLSSKAPVGQRIQLTFNSKFSVTCSSNVVAPCSRFDWVEIRSKINEFEVGGPRFCCSTAPSKVFESDKNEMMILFYSTVTSSYNSYGFQASFTFK